ncbi:MULTISPECIES: TolC family protein [Psychrilyobacter]|uniref:TolC family protein n=1 Tax=Psychrilyobacter piezotolerans TaxID=2293438 RepID=A0ABX9KJK5_9FUSO|nr:MULTISPECIES: TolC family protein [Psychrilyobacter]MCS5421073.1 TolC family protein [Psychrilyobacter sp. S5]NDI76766.1 TolC family protein [Psychrilyobacter piezotolerans]RDE65050.1 TolC family protein [Psychrilyobacter sp. S5]REI42620.1 TolC family protein [Psychrilyobacter piezotolerans]
MKAKKIILISWLLLITGCSSYVRETHEDLMQTKNDIQLQGNFTSSEDQNLVFVHEKWWSNYNDPDLNKLMEIALNSNADLKVAEFNIQAASAAIDAAEHSAFQMGLYAGASVHGTSKPYTKSKAVSKSISIPGGPTLTSTLLPEDALAGETAYAAGAGISANYNFDFYDKYENLTKEQRYLAESAKFHSKLVELNITTNIAKLYGYYIYLQGEKINLHKKLAILTSIQDKVRARVEFGGGEEEDLLIIQNKILTLKRYINLNDFQKESTAEIIYSLSSYKNRDRVEKILKNAEVSRLMEQEFIIPNKISSDVIVNRPDVQYYLMMIKSQKAKLKSLKSDFYPQVSIGGDVGYRGVGLDNSFKDFSSLMWSFGPKVYLPVFNLSGIKANYKIAGIQVNVFIADYNKTINNSIQDINTKLSSAKISKINYINLDHIEKNEGKIYKNSNFKFKIGSISEYENLKDHYIYLDSSLYKTQQAYKLYSDQIDLINSLGGVYKSREQ